MEERKRGILVVSFGTSYSDTCRKTIDAIEDQIRKASPEYSVFRAWSCRKIREKIEKNENIHILDVESALERMRREGMEEMIVQPTYMIHGSEQERMEKDVQMIQERWNSEISERQKEFLQWKIPRIRVGVPLLNTVEDCAEAAECLIREWKLDEGEVLVLMGHGAQGNANVRYAQINEQLVLRGCGNRRIAVRNGSPQLTDLLTEMRGKKIKKVVLAPFMITAGSHAAQEMAGEQETSWKRIFEREGYETECVRKGLGEYEGIRKMIQKHLESTRGTEE